MTFFDGWPILLEHIVLWGSFLEILTPRGAAGDKSRVFGNLEFTNNSCLQQKMMDCFLCFSEPCFRNYFNGIHFLMRLWWEWSWNLLLGVIERHVTFRYGNIEKMTSKFMFLKFCKTRSRETRGESILELFPTTPTYQNPININLGPVLCKVSWILGYSVC